MENKLDEAQLQQLASQLRCPEGTEGLKVAELMNASNANIISRTQLELHIEDNDVILEIGPGNGLHVKDLIIKNPKITYHGVDISDTMVAEAKQQFINTENVNFQLSDGDSLPFVSASFTKVFTVNTIYFWNNAHAYTNEISRVLKPGGVLSVGFIPERIMQKIPFCKYGFTMWSESAVRSLLEASDFKVFSEVTEKEHIMGNNGESIEREFVVTSAEKV